MTARRRFGSVRKQPNGRYQARYKAPNGQERQGEHTFATKGDAQRFLAGVEADLHRGIWSDPRSRAVTLDRYARHWLEHRRLAPRTVELYEDLLRLHISPQLGGMPLGQITPTEVRQWHTGRLASTGLRRAEQAYSLLRTVLGTAVQDGRIASNPCHIRGAGSSPTPPRPYLSREQAETLADAMPRDMRAVVIVTLWAHLRLGELLALRRADVDLTAGTVHIHRQVVRLKDGPMETAPKTKKGRRIHLPRQAIEELRRHMASSAAAEPTARLFTHHSGRPLARHHVSQAWTRARKEVGLQQFHFHDLRHAGLTYAAQKGATMKELMARGGHDSPRAALIYQHAADSRDAEIAAMLSDDPAEANDNGSAD